MNLQVWAELMEAYDDAVRDIGGAFADPRARPDLDGLRVKLADRLATLREELTEMTSAEQARRLIRPLVFLVDELVLVKLPDSADIDWPALQRDFAVDGGGDVFFEDIRRLTGRGKAEASESHVDVAAEYLFCLRAGFSGRYFDDRAALRDAAECLVDELPLPPPLVIASAAEGPSPQPRSMIAYVGAALAAVLVLQAVLLAVSSIF